MHVYRVTVPGGSDTCTCGWQGKLSCMVPTHEAARSRGGWPGPGVRVCTRLHRGLHNQVTFWSPNQGFGAALTSASRNPKLWNPCFVKAHFVHEQLRPGVAGVGCLPMSWRQEWKLVLEGCPRPFLFPHPPSALQQRSPPHTGPGTPASRRADHLPPSGSGARRPGFKPQSTT